MGTENIRKCALVWRENPGTDETQHDRNMCKENIRKWAKENIRK
jgi:hypothetical protein